MANVVVVGAQWGDEGKGKIVDWLSERADIVVRFQGGHNAGHTLVIRGRTYKLFAAAVGRRAPGQARRYRQRRGDRPVGLDCGDRPAQDTRCARLARYVAHCRECDPHFGRCTANSTRCAKRAAGSGKIGTTGRGIGPAYEDKVGRRAIRVQDLKTLSTLGPKVDRILAHHNALRRGLGKPELEKQTLLAELEEIAPQILPYVDVVWDLLDRERKAGKRILFEGAQGALLDIDHGTYPFVTSSNTVAAQAATGSGVGPRAVGYVLGIAKAIRPASDQAPSRRNCLTTSASGSARRDTSSAPSPAARAAAAGSMRCWCARPSRSPGSTASR